MYRNNDFYFDNDWYEKAKKTNERNVQTVYELLMSSYGYKRVPVGLKRP
jgi:hypothetical protein